MAARIVGLGHYHPGEKIDNSFFDSLDIGSDAGWVKDRTGIGKRHSVLKKEDIIALKTGAKSLKDLRAEDKVMSLAHMAEESYKVLRQRILGDFSSVDALICGTSIPDFDIPANACAIAARLNLSCPSFDVNSACSSFVVNLHVAKSLIEAGSHSEVAIFNPERYSIRINYEDRNSAILFGDGCSSALVTDKELPGLIIKDTLIQSDPSNYLKVKVPDGECFSQQGHAVQKFAITKTIECSKKVLERNNLEPKDLSYFAGHQANLRMVESAATKLGIPKERHLYNVDTFGNQGSAGAPSVLSIHWDKFKKGDLIMVSVVGSGLTWGSALLEMA